MFYVALGVVVIVAWFWWAKQMGAKFAREVAAIVARRLKGEGEPEGAVYKYLNSMAFAITWKSAYHTFVGHMPTAWDAAETALAEYKSNTDFWRK